MRRCYEHIYFYIFLWTVFATVPSKTLILHLLSVYYSSRYGARGIGRSRFPPKEWYSYAAEVGPQPYLLFLSSRCLPWKQGHCPPEHIIPSRSFLTVGGCVSGSLLTRSSKVHCTRHWWWVGVLRWQENWNGTPRTHRLHAIPPWRQRFFWVWLHLYMSARLSSFVSSSLTHSLCWRALYFVLLSLQIQQKKDLALSISAYSTTWLLCKNLVVVTNFYYLIFPF